MPFVPDSFDVPAGIHTRGFALRKLTIYDLVQDFAAVASSREHLQGIFGPNDPWPADVTLAQDLVDLGWHQKEFELRRSFTYTVVAADTDRCLGCVYIYPCDKRNFDAQVFLWVRQSELESGLDEALYSCMQDWLAREWPFSAVAFPGRAVCWQEWLHLP